jgi:hypothetical protein
VITAQNVDVGLLREGFEQCEVEPVIDRADVDDPDRQRGSPSALDVGGVVQMARARIVALHPLFKHRPPGRGAGANGNPA